ncbi:MAG: cyclic nucleotide-binding domain-containing protein, partial [Candidatus Promineifilaceae bacterium]
MTEQRSQSNDSLPDSELAKELQFQLASRAEKRRYDQGIVVVKQGEEADSFFVILSGDAEVIQERENRPPRIIATLSGGDHFGEIGLFEGIRRTASVRVSGSTGLEVLMLDRATFQEFVTSSEQTEEEIAAIVKQRLRTLQLATALPSLHADELSRISPQLERMKFGP